MLKILIQKFFNLLGYQIIRIMPPNAQGLIIKSPILHNTKEQLNVFYSDSEIVRQYLTPERINFYQKIIKLSEEKLFDFEGKSIVDIGCGTGHFLLALEEYLNKNDIRANLFGLEFSEAAIRIAKKTIPNASFIQYDIYDETCAGNQFDIIYCMEVLEHLLYPDKALKNICKMCSIHGKTLITVPDGRHDTFDGHINFWSPEGWKVFIEQNCECLGLNYEVGTMNKTNFAIIFNYLK